MNLIAYLLIYPIIWLLSKLPFKLLYLFSDFVYVILFYIIGYRKKVVYNNLKLAFPTKSNKEILAIRRKFYHHLTDMFLEMIKTFSISENELKRRFQIEGIELIRKYEVENKDVILLISHYASWEWSISLNTQLKHKGVAVYKQVKNPYLDNLVKKIRAKYNTTLIPKKVFRRVVANYQKENILTIFGMVSDQSPQPKNAKLWMKFLGIQVPVFIGAEMLAKQYDKAVCYLKVTKIKRGYYKASIELIADKPSDFEDFKITEIYMRKLEQQIIDNPAYYFWTHKRFKHRDKAPSIKKIK